MILNRKSTTVYDNVNSSNSFMSKSRTFTQKSKNFLTLFLSFIIMFLIMSGIVANKAMADDDPIQKINSQAKDEGYADGDQGLEKATSQNSTERSNTIAYLVYRVLGNYYLNDVTDSYMTDDGKKNWPTQNQKYACDTKAVSAAGVSISNTPIYHNCDVPNISTEFMQGLLKTFVPSGPINAEVTSATLDNSWFGLPTNIPDVPSQYGTRASSGEKYTALELFGYNLKFTSYDGEWDDIKVMSSARALSNFGLMDKIGAGGQAIVSGIGAGVSAGLSNAGDAISRGDIIGAVGGFFSGFFKDGFTATLLSIMDTSDANVFGTNAWFRLNYGNTMYGQRELTDTELGNQLEKNLVTAVSQEKPDEVKIPQDLKDIENLPAPNSPSGECMSYETSSSQGNKVDASSLEDCKTAANNAGAVFGDSNNLHYKWNTTTPGEKSDDWNNRMKDNFSIGEKYGITGCKIGNYDNDSVSDMNNAYTQFKACWTPKYKTALDQTVMNKQKESMNSFVANTILNSDWLAKHMTDGLNFNLPQNRFVCTTFDQTTGQWVDKKDSSNNFIFVYNKDGTKNTNCDTQVRPPIQNGLFGNGYTTASVDATGNGFPEADGRRDKFDNNIISSILGTSQLSQGVANLGLSTSIFFTRISNTAVNLSFSPLIHALGLDEVVAQIIENLRDSIFYPLLVLMIGISAIWVFVKTAKNKAYGSGFISILLIIATMAGGIFLMTNPRETIKIVDTVPSQIETAILGSIYGADQSNNSICSSGYTKTQNSGTDLAGNQLSVNPSDTTRQMMCQVWEIFAFDPYVYGQWGTSYNNLTADKFGLDDSINKLVSNGDDAPSVPMGAGSVERNWALYQLQVTSSGSAYHVDRTTNTGNISRNFYKLIDAQMGPNNSVGRNTKYADNWSGGSFATRGIAGLFSPVVSLVGMITIVTYSFTKIVISFVSIFMLLLLPFIFLLGLHPTIGRSKLKSYFGTLIGLFIQRIFLVILLAVFYKVLIGIALSSSGYLPVAFGTLVTCTIFMMYKKEILGLVTKGSNQKLGQFGGDSLIHPMGAVKNLIPRSIKNTAYELKEGAIGTTTGFVGGYMAGGIRQAFTAANQQRTKYVDIVRNEQRFAGFSPLQRYSHAAGAGKASAAKGFSKLNNNSPLTVDPTNINNDINKKLNDRNSDRNKVNGNISPIPPGDYMPPRKQRQLSKLQKLNAKNLKSDEKSLNKMDREGKLDLSSEKHDNEKKERLLNEIDNRRKGNIKDNVSIDNKRRTESPVSENRATKRAERASDIADQITNNPVTLKDKFRQSLQEARNEIENKDRNKPTKEDKIFNQESRRMMKGFKKGDKK